MSEKEAISLRDELDDLFEEIEELEVTRQQIAEKVTEVEGKMMERIREVHGSTCDCFAMYMACKGHTQ